MNAALKHYLNPLHIYCRLREIGMGKEKAVALCSLYERYVFKYFLTKAHR